VVLVTHRTSMLALVNRVIVVDGGKIVADGPRDRIMEALAGGSNREGRLMNEGCSTPVGWVFGTPGDAASAHRTPETPGCWAPP
jgi:energy-coupling factor transporter ATP-binding protein EcfA2